MSNACKESRSLLAIHLIEEQLKVLPVSIAMILQPAKAGAADAGGAPVLMLHRKKKQAKTGSAGNIVVDNAQATTVLDFQTSNKTLHESPLEKATYLRVVISNALLSIGMFLKEHDLGSMRTPEIQFLDHVMDAILNANTFKIPQGYIPMATFDGLVIDSSLNGKPLFGDGEQEGFMEFGDAVALLQWLAHYLHKERHFVSGGDAG
ncbi:hypothetical protein [Herminiimonas contaminans]|uniref:Uncharacterized protein n=1 Tax=Herminiimonas contaminans TaxID=1111140 RepID=A0ABS0EV69_9BURK|nr:hypothetical protein [Herminiimonas contaminans]MBF8178748.1 hypothetical protein [Herminiimonas contaminans]